MTSFRSNRCEYFAILMINVDFQCREDRGKESFIHWMVANATIEYLDQSVASAADSDSNTNISRKNSSQSIQETQSECFLDYEDSICE